MHPLAEHAADGRQPEATAKRVEPRADRPIGDAIDEPPLHASKPGRPAVHEQDRQ